MIVMLNSIFLYIPECLAVSWPYTYIQYYLTFSYCYSSLILRVAPEDKQRVSVFGQ